MANPGSQLDVLIRILIEGLDKARSDVAEFKQDIARMPEGDRNLEMFRGVVQGMEQEIEAINKRKMALVDQAAGQAMQREAALIEAEIKKEIKALEDFEKAKAKQIATFQKGEQSLAEAMAKGREKSEEAAQARRDEMEASQKAAKEKSRDADLAKAVAEETALAKQQIAALTEGTKENEEATKKSTEAKKNFRESMKGLATEFPGLSRLLNIATTGWGALAAAAAAAVKIVVSSLQEMAAQRAAAAALAREIEKLSGGFEDLEKITARQQQATADFVTDYQKRFEAVEKLNEAISRQQRERVAIEATNSAIAAETLRGQLLDVDDSKLTPAQKEVQKGKLISAAKEQAAKDAIEAKRKAASDAFGNASKQERLEKELLGQADTQAGVVAAAERNKQIADMEKAKADTVAKADIADAEEQLKWTRRALQQKGGTFRNGMFYTPQVLKTYEQQALDRIADAKEKTKTPDADAAFAAENLAREQARLEELKNAAKSASERARGFERTGRDLRQDYDESLLREGNLRPSQRSNDEREYQQRARELEGRDKRRDGTSVIGPESTGALLGALDAQTEFNATVLQRLAEHEQRINDQRLNA